MSKRFIIIGLVIFVSFIKADFASAAARFWVGGAATANWSEATGGITNWGTVSNTRDNAAVPTSADDVTFDNSANGNSPSTISAGITIKSFTATAYTNTLTHNAAVTLTVAGNVTFGASMTYTLVDPATSAVTVSAASTFTSNGKTIGNFINTGANTALGDAMVSSGTITTASSPSGIFNANNFNITAAIFTLGRSVTMGSGTWQVTGTGAVWTNTATTTANTSTIKITDTSASTKTFTGGGQTYNNITFTGDNITVTGANTFNVVAINNAGLTNGLLLTSAVTQTITRLTTNGSAGSLAKLVSTTGGSAATLSSTKIGKVCVDYMSIKDITVKGSAIWLGGTNSRNVSGNTGWNFTNSCIGHQIRGKINIRGVVKFR